MDAVIQGLIAFLALAVSVVAVIPAFRGLSQARKANEAAHEANEIAAQANRIALSAEELSHRTEVRMTETYDVEWTVGWADDHHFFIRNQGLDSAHDVRFRIGGPWGAASNEGPSIVEAWSDFEVPCDSTLSQSKLSGAVVHLRIVWTSPAGTPHKESLLFPGPDVFARRRPVG